MQVTVEDLSAVKKKIRVELPREDVSRELDNAFNKLKKNAKVKGYRPGKTPRSVLERLFRKDVYADVVSNLVQTSFPEAIKEADLAVIDTRDIDTPDLDPETSFTYDAIVELRPQLPDVAFKGLELKKTEYPVRVEEIDKQIDMLRKHMAEYKPAAEDRAVADGEFVVIDYEGKKGGEPFPPTLPTADHTFKIGNSGFTRDFDQALIGMKAGERKEFTVSFPAEHSRAELAGQEIDFTVTLKELREEVLPPVDDELAKKFGPFETVQDLRNQIDKHLREGYEKRAEQEIQEQIFNNLLTETFDIPEVLVQYELDEIIKDTELRFAHNGISMEQLGMTRELMEQQYRDIAEKQVRRHVLLNKIIEQEKLEISDVELDGEFAKMSEATGQPVDFINSYYRKNPEKRDAMKHALLEKRAIDLIIDHASVEKIAPEKTDGSENQPESE